MGKVKFTIEKEEKNNVHGGNISQTKKITYNMDFDLTKVPLIGSSKIKGEKRRHNTYYIIDIDAEQFTFLTETVRRDFPAEKFTGQVHYRNGVVSLFIEILNENNEHDAYIEDFQFFSREEIEHLNAFVENCAKTIGLNIEARDMDERIIHQVLCDIDNMSEIMLDDENRKVVAEEIVIVLKTEYKESTEDYNFKNFTQAFNQVLNKLISVK